MLKALTAILLLAAALTPVTAEALPIGCLPSPLPTTPTPPAYSLEFHFFDDRALGTIWRQACTDGSGDVAVLIRLTAVTVNPFVCSTDAEIEQNGILRPARLATSTRGLPSFCEKLVVPTTVVLLVDSIHPDYDETAAFTLIYNRESVTPSSVLIPAANVAVAAILPGSRAVKVGATATAFATMLAPGSGTATGCSIAPSNAPAGTAFQYQQTNAANVPIGAPNTPATIPGGSGQSFVISLTPTSLFAATAIRFTFDCANTDPAAVLPGVNTLLLTSTSGPTPDIVALGATVTNDGIANIPDATGTGFFSVATVNVGAGASITATVDTGGANLPVVLSLCQTNPATGQCVNPATPGSSATVQIGADQTSTFAIFVRGTGNVPFDPGVNRAFVRFETASGATVGATSVAVRTQ